MQKSKQPKPCLQSTQRCFKVLLTEAQEEKEAPTYCLFLGLHLLFSMRKQLTYKSVLPKGKPEVRG